MTAPYREISYEAPLKTPVENQAWIAERAGDWRLLIYPGTPARKYHFERMLRLAPKDLEVVLLARPGFARGHKEAFLNFEDQVAAGLPFIEDGRKIVTMGVSYGGQLALKALVDHPGKIKGAVTLAALVTEPRDWVHPFLDLGGAPVVRDLVPRHLHLSRAEIAGRRPQIGPLFEKLKAVDAPVTIVHGDADHLVSRRDARQLATYFGPKSDVKFRHVAGGTHFLEFQRPNLVYDIVRDVMARADAMARH